MGELIMKADQLINSIHFNIKKNTGLHAYLKAHRPVFCEVVSRPTAAAAAAAACLRLPRRRLGLFEQRVEGVVDRVRVALGAARGLDPLEHVAPPGHGQHLAAAP